MSSIDAFMLNLTDLDIKLRLEEGKLTCNAPRDVLTTELQSALKDRKAEIIDYLEKAQNRRVDSIPRADRNTEINLSVSQKRLWSLAQLQPNTSIYNISTAYRLKGNLKLPLLEKSLKKIQNRHEILRTTFSSKQSHPVQVISNNSDVKITIQTLACVDLAKQHSEIINYLNSEVGRPFELSKGPLWRVTVLVVGDEDFVLSLTFHHIIFDAWSRQVFLSEFGECYNHYNHEKIPELLPLPVQYADYAEWHNIWLESGVLSKQIQYWEKQLAAPLAELILPTDNPRPAKRVFKNGSYSFSFSESLYTDLNTTSRKENVSLFIILLAAFNLTLFKYTGQTNLALCLPVACRNRSEIENLIGYFNNIVVMRTELSNHISFRELIFQVRKITLEAFENQDFPFQKLMEQLGLMKIRLTRAMFSFRNQPEKLLNLHGVDTIPLDIRKPDSDFDLAMYMEFCEGQLSGVLEYNSELFETMTIELLVDNFRTILTGMSTDIAQQLSSIPEYRVHSNDISSLLREHSKVEDAFVLRSDSHRDNQCNIAYIIPNQHDIPEIAELRSHLEQKLAHYHVPLTFIPVDSFPLTADGKVDESALPQPNFSRVSSSDTYVQAKTPLEKKLAKVWTKVLWLDEEIGVEDNFLTLGGNSLLSVELVHEIEKELQLKLPANALVKLSTIKELIANIEHESESDSDSHPGYPNDSVIISNIHRGLLAHTAGWHGKRVHAGSLIFGLNGDGQKEPLFWCFQGYREFSQMAKYLGADQPVYGMRSGHRVMEKNEKNMSKLADYYASEILTIKAKGPLLIGGNCQSAQIAFRIARSLMDKGHFIKLLCLQEQFVALPYPGRVAMFYGDDSGNNPLRYFENPEEEWKRYYTGDLSVNMISGKHGEFFREPNVQVLAEKLTMELANSKRKQELELTAQQHDQAKVHSAQNCQARITALNTIFAVPGESLWVTAKVENIGKIEIVSGDIDTVTLGYRCLKEWGNNILSIDSGTSLLSKLEPGRTAFLQIQLKIPVIPGHYRFQLDLVENEILWFKTQGSLTATITARVGKKFVFFKWYRMVKSLFLGVRYKRPPNQTT